MSHANAPLSIEGRRRLVERCKTRPIAHVAAEMGISRTCASKWVNRWRRHGDAGLQDRSSTPHRSPRSEEHTSELQSRGHLVCRLLLEKKNKQMRSIAPRATIHRVHQRD